MNNLAVSRTLYQMTSIHTRWCCQANKKQEQPIIGMGQTYTQTAHAPTLTWGRQQSRQLKNLPEANPFLA